MVDTASPDSGKKLFFGLFIFPLLIAVGMAALLCSVVLMTHEEQTPETLLEALKKSPPSKRWQKAFELSNEINRDPASAQNPAIYRQMLQILRDREAYDAKTRSYMALALARQTSDEVFSALEETLGDPDEEVRVHALWSLGAAGRKGSAIHIEPLLKDDSAETRKTAAYVLGALGSADSAGALQNILKDPVVDVRWNAALALARVGNAEGYDVLLSMLERGRLAGEFQLDEQRIESTMINAMKGLVLIPRRDSIKILETISKEDKNLRVRQASLDSLSVLEKNIL
jgi:HEAT repeat protein